MQEPKSIVFLGASGAVGSETLKQLLSFPEISKILLLGRKKNDAHNTYQNIEQHEIDIHNAETYQRFIENFTTAICTLGVGEPSKISKEEFIKIDKIAVLTFAKACKKNGVKHFQLLSSIGISSTSSNFFLRTKGELVDELKNLQFERLSIFQPSMILTPNNRYGFVQGLTLAVWPKLNLILGGGLRKYRGIKVEILGKAIANNVFEQNTGLEYLQYDDFEKLTRTKIS